MHWGSDIDFVVFRNINGLTFRIYELIKSLPVSKAFQMELAVSLSWRKQTIPGFSASVGEYPAMSGVSSR